MGGENKSQSKDVLFTRSRVRLFRTNWCEILCNLNSWRPFTHYPSFSLSPPQSITSCLPLILRSATRSRADGDTRHLDVDYKGGEDFSFHDAAPPNLFPINYCYLLLCRRGGGKCPFSEDIFPKNFWLKQLWGGFITIPHNAQGFKKFLFASIISVH